MRLVVPDASVLVKWVLSAPDEEDQAAALRLRDSILARNVAGAVPALWVYEVSNVLFRRVPDLAPDMVRALVAFGLPQGESSAAWFDAAARLVLDYKVTFYDAAYHALAIVLRGVHVTADARYVRKAGAAGAVLALAEWDVDAID